MTGANRASPAPARASRILLTAAIALAAGLATGYLAARRAAAPPDPARTQLAELCRRGGRAFAADPPAGARSVLHGVLGLSCVPPHADRAARNAAADAWSGAVDRCLAAAAPAACAEIAALAEQYAAQLSAR